MSGLRDSIKLRHLAKRAEMTKGTSMNTAAENMRRENMISELYTLERKAIQQDVVNHEQIADIQRVIEVIGEGANNVVNFTERKLKIAR